MTDFLHVTSFDPLIISNDEPGPAGSAGAAGPKGDKGDKGDTGPAGGAVKVNGVTYDSTGNIEVGNVVAQSTNLTAQLVQVSASGTVGTKQDIPHTGITVFPSGSQEVTLEFGGTIKQTVAGAGSFYVTIVELGPTIATRTLLFSHIDNLPNSIDPSLQLKTFQSAFNIGVVTAPRTFELQILAYAAPANSPTIQINNAQPTWLRAKGRGISYSQTAKVGRVQAGEADEIFTPAVPWTGCPVILMHGAGENANFTHATTQMHAVNIAAYLAANGIPCIAGDFGGANTFSNDTTMSRMSAAKSVINAAFPNCRQDKVILLGISMGGGASARFSQLHPEQVAGIVGLIPAFDINDVYVNNRSGLQGLIGTAWGVTYPTPLPAGALFASTSPNPAANIPHLLGYSTADTTVIPSTVTAYAASVNCFGPNLVVTDTTAGHTDIAVGGMPLDTILNFVKSYGK